MELMSFSYNYRNRQILKKMCIFRSKSYLFGKHSDVLVKWIGRAHISSSDSGLSRCACGQLALLKHQRQQRE